MQSKSQEELDALELNFQRDMSQRKFEKLLNLLGLIVGGNRISRGSSFFLDFCKVGGGVIIK